MSCDEGIEMPNAKWKKNAGFKPSLVLEKILSIGTVQPDERASYAVEHMQLRIALQSMIAFKDTLVWPIRISAISKALSATIKSEEPTQENFMNELNNALKALLSTKKIDYHLLTTVSLNGERPLKACTIDGCHIRFIKGPYPKKYSPRHEQEKYYNNPGKPTPAEYQKVIVSTKARHPQEAVHKCLRSLDICRALLCLFTNYKWQISYGWSYSKMPINRIVLGNMHSLHLHDGSLNDKSQYWYEPYSENPEPCSYTAEKAKKLRKDIMRMLSNIDQSKYGNQIKASLVRYVRALDERDANSATIKMWGALETLAKGPNENYNAIINRCSFILPDSQIHKQILEALRETRNESVHAGEYSEEARTNCYMMQFYFYCLFMFHVNYCRYFRSFAEANEFLDLPANKTALNRQAELRAEAIKFKSSLG